MLLCRPKATVSCDVHQQCQQLLKVAHPSLLLDIKVVCHCFFKLLYKLGLVADLPAVIHGLSFSSWHRPNACSLFWWCMLEVSCYQHANFSS